MTGRKTILEAAASTRDESPDRQEGDERVMGGLVGELEPMSAREIAARTVKTSPRSPIPTTKKEIVANVRALQDLLPRVELEIEALKGKLKNEDGLRLDIAVRINMLEHILDRDWPDWWLPEMFPEIKDGDSERKL